MATSSVTTFNSTKKEIITDALSAINAIGEGETPSSYDFERADRILNRMVKAWELKGIHLWTKTTAIVFLQKNKTSYQLASTKDHASVQWWKTTLDGAVASGAVSLTVDSTADMTVGDYIGIEQSDNTLHWSTIATIPDGTTVTVDDATTAVSNDGAVVWNYTTRLDQPVKVYSANYRDRSDRDVPMELLSYQTYFELPNKSNTGTPVSYRFDKQRDYSVIDVWLTPADVKFNLIITFSRKIQDFVSVNDNPDFPQEWQQCLISNLSVKLAPYYGKNKGDKYNDLMQTAIRELTEASGFDNEGGSMYFTPSDEGESNE